MYLDVRAILVVAWAKMMRRLVRAEMLGDDAWRVKPTPFLSSSSSSRWKDEMR